MAAERNERGLALVSVLWGVAILSLIASAVLTAAVLSAQLTRNGATVDEAAAVADAGIARAILALEDTRPEARWPVDGTPHVFKFDSTLVQVSIADEAGKIDLNLASHDTLQALFELAGVASNEASILADRVVDWRSTETGVSGDTASDYDVAGYTSHPRKAPFQSVGELKLVIGITPALFARIEPALTIYSHLGAINTATAPRQALLAIPGMDARKADDMIAARQLTAVQGAAPAVRGHAFTIRAEVRAGGTVFVRRAVIGMTGDPVKPYLVYDWQ